VTDAWKVIVSLLQSGAIKPIVAKTFPLAEVADALCFLVEGRPLREGCSHNLTVVLGGMASLADRHFLRRLAGEKDKSEVVLRRLFG
jgi:hypothetical protein